MKDNAEMVNIMLPDWLYYTSSSSSESPSPAACFKPASAINDGVAWQSSVSPQEQKKCKAIILDKSMYCEGLNEQRWAIIISFLQDQGFNIYICSEKGPYPAILSCQESITNTEYALSNTREFDKESDYERLAGLQIARDKCVFVVNDRLKELSQCLHKTKRHMQRLNQESDIFCDVSSYHVSIPKVLKFKNDIVPNIIHHEEQDTSLSDVNELKNAIDKNPCQLQMLLKNNLGLLDDDFVKLILNEYPSEIAEYAPILHEHLGLSDVNDINYYLALRDRIRSTDIPWKNFSTINSDDFKKCFQAFKDMEDSFEELLPMLNSKLLLEHFPLHAKEILAGNLREEYVNLVLSNLSPMVVDGSIADEIWRVLSDDGNTKKLREEALFVLYNSSLSYKDDIFNKLCSLGFEKGFGFYLHKCRFLSKHLNQLEGQYPGQLSLNSHFEHLNVQQYILEYHPELVPFKDLCIGQISKEFAKKCISALGLRPKTAEEMIYLIYCYPEKIEEILAEHHNLLESEVTIQGDRLTKEQQKFISDTYQVTFQSKHNLSNPKFKSICQPQIIDNLSVLGLPELYENFSDYFTDVMRKIDKIGNMDKMDEIDMMLRSYRMHSTHRRIHRVREHLFEISRHFILKNINPVTYSGEQLNSGLCKSLYIGLINQDILTFLSNSNFGNVECIEIGEIDGSISLEHLQGELQKTFPKLNRLSVSNNYLQTCKSWPYKIEAALRLHTIKEIISFKKNIPQHSNTDDGKLYLNTDETSNKTSHKGDKGEASEYTMTLAGERLNHKSGQRMHGIRNSKSKMSEDFKTRLTCAPEVYQEINDTQLLNEVVIKQYKKSSSEFYFYKFSIAAQPGDRIRLPSIDGSDILEALSVTNDATYKLEKGDDDFYYLTVSKPCECSYVVQSPPPDKTMDESLLPAEIKEILSDYRNQPNYEPASKDIVGKKDSETYPEWFKRLFESGKGRCSERCYGVWYKIITNHPEFAQRINFIGIDNNHVRLEYKSENWRSIQIDLGGRDNAVLHYDNRTKYNPIESKVDKTPAPTQKSSSQPLSFKKKLGDKELEIRAYLKQQSSPIPIDGFDEIKSIPGEPTLLIHQSTSICANAYLDKAQKDNKPVFYLHDPKQLKIAEPQLHLTNNKPLVSELSALDLFIKQHGEQGILLINWSAFSAQDKVAYNSVLDRNPSLGSSKINMPVISICNDLPEDNSFIKRHKKIYEPKISSSKDMVPEEVIELDFMGLTNWQETLFGEVILDNNEIVWHPGLYQKLDMCNITKNTRFDIKNCPGNAKDKIKNELEIACAQGFFDYHHEKLIFPKNIEFAISLSPLSLKSFNTVKVYKNVTAIDIPGTCDIINTEIFDYLLHGKQIKDGKYLTTPGWLELNQGKEYPLFITSDLSDNQWYCLLNKAESLGITLVLHISRGINMPSFSADLQKLPAKTDIAKPMPFITITKDLDMIASGHRLSFAVEDYNYQDLMVEIDFVMQNYQFGDFEERKSELMSYIDESECAVTLYGSFSQRLINSLATKLCEQAREIGSFGRFNLVIDNAEELDLSFLPSDVIISLNEPKKNKPKTILYQEEKDSTFDLTKSEITSKQFIDDRLQAVKNAISSNGIIQLIGPTGVGKTYLMKTLANNYPDKYEVYHEFGDFEKFASGEPNGKAKVLFLDEANISNKHLTFLAPLTKDGSKRILYKGKVFQLTDEHHIVCAKNPEDYGGGRVQQKLFENFDVPELYLNEIPAAFIYENILKPSYNSTILNMPEDKFKKDCSKFLKDYHARQSQSSDGLCVRDLEEWILQYVLKHKHQQDMRFFHPKERKSTQNGKKHFIMTPSTVPIYQKLQNAITIRTNRLQSNLKDTTGLNGFLIEGKPGMGKSEVMRNALSEAGYSEISPEEKPGNKSLTYLKVDASLPIHEKKRQIQQAFHRGQIVWLDEVNSCMDGNFEQWINAFLSGIDPSTHKPAKKPGFMMLVTANSISMEGRSLIGPALRGRLQCEEMTIPNANDLSVILKKKFLI